MIVPHSKSMQWIRTGLFDYQSRCYKRQELETPGIENATCKPEFETRNATYNRLGACGNIALLALLLNPAEHILEVFRVLHQDLCFRN